MLVHKQIFPTQSILKLCHNPGWIKEQCPLLAAWRQTSFCSPGPGAFSIFLVILKHFVCFLTSVHFSLFQMDAAKDCCQLPEPDSQERVWTWAVTGVGVSMLGAALFLFLYKPSRATWTQEFMNIRMKGFILMSYLITVSYMKQGYISGMVGKFNLSSFCFLLVISLILLLKVFWVRLKVNQEILPLLPNKKLGHLNFFPTIVRSSASLFESNNKTSRVRRWRRSKVLKASSSGLSPGLSQPAFWPLSNKDQWSQKHTFKKTNVDMLAI